MGDHGSEITTTRRPGGISPAALKGLAGDAQAAAKPARSSASASASASASGASSSGPRRGRPISSLTRDGHLLRLVPWWEPELAIAGFAGRSAYVERFWLPLLGPTALLALRWSIRMLGEHPSGVSVSMEDLSLELGLGARAGASGPAPRALERLGYFGLAREHAGTLMVRTHMPAVPPALMRRLPAAMRDSHATWMLHARDQAAEPDGGDPVRRIAALPPK